MILKISPRLVRQFTGERLLRHYSTWLYLKRLYSNGCIFNYTIAGLSKKSGLSRTAIRKYVADFLKRGWCRMHHSHLVFNNQQNIAGKKLRICNLTPLTDTVKGIYDALCAFIICEYQSHQLYRIKQKQRDAHRSGGCASVVPTMCTIRQGARLFQLKPRSANRIFLKLQGQGWFSRDSRYTILAERVSRRVFAVLREAGAVPTHAYLKRGMLVVPEPSVWHWFRLP
jgi:hypothetical protein